MNKMMISDIFNSSLIALFKTIIENSGVTES